jgi:hypothetical protein
MCIGRLRSRLGSSAWFTALERRGSPETLSPRRRSAGDGQSRSSGPHFERHQVLEIEHDALNTPRHSGKPFRARVGTSRDGGGTGSRRQGEKACAEGNREGKEARRVSYLPWKLRRWLTVGDRWRWAELRRREARSAAARTGCSRTARCSAPHGLLVHPSDAHGPCEDAKGVSFGRRLTGGDQFPERPTAYRKSSGGTGQRKGGSGGWYAEAMEGGAGSSCG